MNTQWLESQYDMIHRTREADDCANFDGTMTTTIWRKKTLKELAKRREMLAGVRVLDDVEDKAEEPEHASRSPQFNRKEYKYLSDKEFHTRKPKV